MIVEFLENVGMVDWAVDAICDSFAVLPFLFVIFLLVEFFEFYFSDKVNKFMKSSQKSGPIIGSFAAIIPQCGFSVIASTLYVRRFITRGTLIAIYLATSDEAIPVLLSNPSQYHFIMPIICIKLFVAIIAGYVVDIIFKQDDSSSVSEIDEDEHAGCCKHDILTHKKSSLVIHPIKHTLNTFVFILLITLILNYFISIDSISSLYASNSLVLRMIQPVITALIGLIPNCAVSIAITLMLIKGSISFGSAVAGLMANAGLGFLVLVKANNIKDTLKIVGILLFVSILSGVVLQLL